MSPFERIRKVSDEGHEYWESRDLPEVLEYTPYRNFEGVIGKGKPACANSGRRIEDHFADVSKMVRIGSVSNEIKGKGSAKWVNRYTGYHRGRCQWIPKLKSQISGRP